LFVYIIGLEQFMGYVIYEASAGSGKTTKMVYEYLQKLFFLQPQELKQAVESSVAITFTNKATSEMKERILTTLWRFINNDIPNEYKILESTLLNNKIDITKQSRLILSTVLHNYYIFNITTIDSFIQKIARSIAYELELPINYKVSLDANKIISMACKRIIKKLGKDLDNSEVTGILQEFVNYSISEKNQYNIENALIDMAQSFSNEQFYSIIENLSSSLDMNSFYEACLTKYKNIKNELTSKANQFIQQVNDMLNAHNLQYKDIFSYNGAGNYTLLQKLGNPGTDFSKELIRTSFQRFEPLIKKSFNHNEKATIEKYITTLFDEIKENYLIKEAKPEDSVPNEDKKGFELLKANAILKTYFIIVLMEYIFKEIENIAKEENTVLLSEFTRIMQKKINENDIPYIFMKLDCEIMRLFIDEFQDTSQLQWKNLELFKENMISENRDFYIIGDPKQSIYRWRNGDVKIMLNEIDFIEKKMASDDDYNHISLDINYRSLPTIIEFNNDFFSKLISVLENDPYSNIATGNQEETYSPKKKLFDTIISSYKKLIQKPSTKNKQEGFVMIEIIQRPTKSSSTDNSETEESDTGTTDLQDSDETNVNTESTAIPQESISKCVAFIKDLLQKGYRQQDIAILIRENRQAFPLTEIFLKEGIDFINNNALAIYNSPAVQCLLNLLNYFANTEDTLSLYTAMQLYIQYYSNDITIIHIFENIHEHIKSKTYKLYNLYELFHTSDWFKPFKIVNEQFFSLKSLDLYNLAEELIRIFKFNEQTQDYIYLQFFLDYIFDYVKNNDDSISDFLSYYKNNKDKFLLSLNEQTNAVQIMSIHMSKGLQFPVVILPDADFDIKKDNYITAPIFSSIYSIQSNNSKTPIYYIYKNHKSLLQLGETRKPALEAAVDTIHDNINLLYVAMTRAEQVLYMIVPVRETKNEKKSNSILKASSTGSIIRKALGQYEIPLCIQKGKIPESNSHSILNEQSAQSGKNYPEALFVSNFWQSKLVIKTNSDNIALALNHERREQIDFGNLMHRFLSEIHSVSDIAETIKKPYYAQLSLNIQNNLIRNAEWVWKEFQNRGWTAFSKHYFERAVIYNGEEKRPDCVFAHDSRAIIIDYKTGLQGDEAELDIKNKYKNQLLVYHDIYLALGYSDIETYIMLPEKHTIITLTE